MLEGSITERSWVSMKCLILLKTEGVTHSGRVDFLIYDGGMGTLRFSSGSLLMAKKSALAMGYSWLWRMK